MNPVVHFEMPGGTVLGEPMQIPGVGSDLSNEDREGHRVGMLQPLPRSS